MFCVWIARAGIVLGCWYRLQRRTRCHYRQILISILVCACARRAQCTPCQFMLEDSRTMNAVRRVKNEKWKIWLTAKLDLFINERRTSPFREYWIPMSTQLNLYPCSYKLMHDRHSKTKQTKCCMKTRILTEKFHNSACSAYPKPIQLHSTVVNFRERTPSKKREREKRKEKKHDNGLSMSVIENLALLSHVPFRCTNIKQQKTSQPTSNNNRNEYKTKRCLLLRVAQIKTD